MNVIYPKAKELMLTNQFDWVNDSIAIALYGASTIYNPLHTLTTDLAGTQTAAGEPLANKLTVIDLASSDNSIYYALSNPSAVTIAVMYRTSDNRLIAFLDEILGFNVTPTGADYEISPSGPSNSWFRL
jgi:hypothetical protein